MRYYLSVDMEGIAGVFTWESSARGHPKAGLACEYMTGEVNAAAEGILAADPDGMGDNLIPDKLAERIELIAGFPRPDAMVTGIEGGFDLAMFIGYHAMVGTGLSTMDHSYSSSSVYRVTINGDVWGETGINAAYAGRFGVPVGLVSGDAGLGEELEKFPAAPMHIVTKKSVARFSSKSLHPAEARRRIKDGAARAVGNRASFEPLTFDAPVTVDIELTFTQKADMAAMIPGAERIDGRTIRFVHDDYAEVFRFFMTLLCVAAAAK